MATDIFIRAYSRDLNWFVYCLKSIDKYASKFRQTVVVCTRGDETAIRDLLSGHKNTVLFLDEPLGSGWAEQQLSKLNSDKYSDADFFLHFDQDCVFTEPVTPLDYATDGKPDLWYDEYDGPNLRAHPGVQAYRPTTAKALGWDVSEVGVETLRRFPILYPRWLYGKVRERIEAVHGMSLQEYVLANIRGLGDFNITGAFAYYKHPGEFTLKHMNDYNLKLPKLKQYWSHVGRKPGDSQPHPPIPDKEKAELENITA